MDQNMDNPNPGDNDLNEPKPPQAPTPFGAEPSETPTPEPTPQPDFQAAPGPTAQAAPGAIPPPPGEPASTVVVTKEAAQWGMFCHLAALAIYLSIPFANILGPLIIWLIKKDDFLFVEDQGKESLNFQISVTIYFLACIPLCFVFIGFPLLIGLGIFNLVMIVISSVAANKGEAYRYPLNLRLIK